MTRRESRPVLLLDADGVVVLLGEGDGGPTFDVVVAGFPVTIATVMPARLARLLPVFQLVWATSWQRDAAEQLGPAVGLPEDLPYLRFDRDLDFAGSSYKLPSVRRFVRGCAVAWVDDELGEDVFAWADGRGQATLLMTPDPRIGLTEPHVDELLSFSRELRRTDGA